MVASFAAELREARRCARVLGPAAAVGILRLIVEAGAAILFLVGVLAVGVSLAG